MATNSDIVECCLAFNYRDVTEVMTSLCARLYGRRSARRRAERALAAAQEG